MEKEQGSEQSRAPAAWGEQGSEQSRAPTAALGNGEEEQGRQGGWIGERVGGAGMS
jgi:hypothetical protein